MSTTAFSNPAIDDFATAVRTALSDLTSDEVDELTDGLEADLAERLADGGGELGDPVSYAEELRSAAGLPRREGARLRPSMFAELRAMPTSLRGEVRVLADRHPSLRGVSRFLVSIRPVWWILRAVIVAWALAEVSFGSQIAPISGPFIALVVVLTVISVQFGRGKWLPFAWMRGVLLVGNVLLAIAVPFLLVGAATSVNNAAYAVAYSNEGYSDSASTGLQLDGNQVSNVFAYDAEGNPLKDVQLFDQDGKPLNLVSDPTVASGDFTDANGSPVSIVPNQGVPGRLGWNVFPLAHVTPDDLDENGAIKHGTSPSAATLPFATATPLVPVAGSAASGVSGTSGPSVTSPTATPTTAIPTPAP